MPAQCVHVSPLCVYVTESYAYAPKQCGYGLGDLPVRKLLGTLAYICSVFPHSLGKIAPSLSNVLIADDYTLSDIAVERERYIVVERGPYAGAGRLDIYLEGVIAYDNKKFPLKIVIENKVKSNEHDGQTKRYQTALRQAVSASEILLSVYLTPLSSRDYASLDVPTCDAKDFIQLNYQYLATGVLSAVKSFAKDSVRRYLDEYLLALGLPELRQDKGDIIMSIGPDERDLLSRFWEKHKELLIAAMLSIADSDAISDEDRAIVKTASTTLSKLDRTRYTWAFGKTGGAALAKGRLALEVITNYVHRNSPITLQELKTVFPDSLMPGKLCTVEALNAADKALFKNHQRYFTDSPIELLDGNAAVCNQWHKDNIIAFIQLSEKLGYEISSTE